MMARVEATASYSTKVSRCSSWTAPSGVPFGSWMGASQAITGSPAIAYCSRESWPSRIMRRSAPGAGEGTLRASRGAYVSLPDASKRRTAMTGSRPLMSSMRSRTSVTWLSRSAFDVAIWTARASMCPSRVTSSRDRLRFARSSTTANATMRIAMGMAIAMNKRVPRVRLSSRIVAAARWSCRRANDCGGRAATQAACALVHKSSRRCHTSAIHAS